MALYRHTLDRRILESMHRYQAIMDNAAEGILLVSCETGLILEANPASSRMSGFTAGELSGMTVSNLILLPGTQAGSWKECAFTREGWSGEVQFRCRDGSLRDVELSSRIIRREGAPDLSCMMAHDVTDLKRAEVALRLAHRKLNLLSGVTRHDILNQAQCPGRFSRVIRSGPWHGPPERIFDEGKKSSRKYPPHDPLHERL